LIFQEKPPTFFYDECSSIGWKWKVLFRYVARFHFRTKRHTFTFQFNHVAHFNGDNCSKEMVHSDVRIPQLKILKRTACWLKNFIFKRRRVTEEGARVPVAEVKLVCSFC
jgi:hypothetical protein